MKNLVDSNLPASDKNAIIADLAVKVGIYDLMTEEQKDILDLLLPLNIEARYPTYKEQLLKSLSYSKCEEILNQTNELKQWIEKLL